MAVLPKRVKKKYLENNIFYNWKYFQLWIFSREFSCFGVASSDRLKSRRAFGDLYNLSSPIWRFRASQLDHKNVTVYGSVSLVAKLVFFLIFWFGIYFTVKLDCKYNYRLYYCTKDYKKEEAGGIILCFSEKIQKFVFTFDFDASNSSRACRFSNFLASWKLNDGKDDRDGSDTMSPDIRRTNRRKRRQQPKVEFYNFFHFSIFFIFCNIDNIILYNFISFYLLF